MESRRFYRAGILALDPQAFGLEVTAAEPSASAPFTLVCGGAVAVVCIEGPLVNSGPLFDTYADIRGRVDLALASSAHTVVLDFDSPGGEVFGVFDAARALRASAVAAGKRLVAFSAARLQSAAYALATAADEIVISSVSSVGSIGVIVAHADVTGADAQLGVKFEVFASGERKADGNPHIKLSDEARASIKQSIDDTAAVFFALVKERRGIDASKFEGRTWIGVAALSDGIADCVESRDSMLQRLASGPDGATTQTQSSQSAHGKNRMADKSEDNEKDADRAALAKAAAAGNAKAKRALAAYDSEDEKEAASDEEQKEAAADEDKKEAASDEEKPAAAADEDKKEASGASAMAAAAGDLVAQLTAAQTEIAALKARNAKTDFAALRASRPDISKKVWETLAPLPLAQATAIVNATPKAANPLAPVVGDPSLEGAPADKDRPKLNAEARVEDIKDPRIAQAMGLIPPPQEFRNTSAVHYPSVRVQGSK